MSARLVGDTGLMLGRTLRHVTRSPDTIVTVTVMPVAFLLLFVYVFGGAVEAGPGRYVDYLVPGILLVAVASGVSYTAFRLYGDLTSGVFERFHSMPIARSSVLWGHVLTSVVANAVSVVAILLVALVVGFRPTAGVLGWLAVAGILALVTLALTWLAVLAGLSASSVEGATAFSYPLVFLPFVSSAFVPTETMPLAVRVFAENQPVTSVVDALRALLAGRPVGDDVWVALAWCVALTGVAWVLAMLAYRRKTA